MSTILQKYGSGIVSFLVVLLTAVTLMPSAPSYVDIFQLVALAASSFVMFLVPLLKGGWVGGLKVGVELVGVLVVALIPFFALGVPTKEQIVVIVIALLKAASTQLGIIIRTDSTSSTGLVPDPASIAKHLAQ